MWLACKEVPSELFRVGSMAGVADGHPGYEGCAGTEAVVRGCAGPCSVSVYSAVLLNS